MKNGAGRLPLSGALILFGIFLINVLAGAFGTYRFFGDVSEMLTLFASVILFVVGVLDREAACGKQSQ
ncbi:hypothetical protein [Amaricoccus macauensis]|uniref:hypothetical protein n=1 Tax=Amaricoccus macauensis TaxID=57001 RepID=UPI003C7D5C91